MSAEIVPLPGKDAIGRAIDNAMVVPQSPSDDDSKGGGPPPNSPFDEPDAPVQPLGLSADGSTTFGFDPAKRLQVKLVRDLSRLGILGLVNERWPWLEEKYPRLVKVKDEKTEQVDWQVTGWRPELFAQDYVAACARKGTLNIADRVRGTGAWRGPNGELILHCGEKVLVDREWRGPGEILGQIYPAQPPTPMPAERWANGGPAGPAAEAKTLFGSWQWKRPEIDPHLMLGAVCAAKIGGALRWRPTTWLTGDFGSGKSTVFEHVAALLGEGGVHSTVDATAAGIWQRTRQSSHPVLIDEAEAEGDPRRMSGMVKLARAASSGGVVYRGGSEHAPIHFTIRGCFFFASILVAGLTPQDRSRITVLELQPLAGIKPPTIAASKLKAMGLALSRRMIDGWPRLEEVFQQYRSALAEHGHRARSADQFGILLACAHMALHDEGLPDADYVDGWCERLPPEREDAKDHQNCVAHLLTTPIDPHRSGGRRTVAQWLEDARSGELGQPAEANRALEPYGLSVEIEPAPDGRGPPSRWLYVANNHRGLAYLFEGSHWVGSSGTTNAWVQSLRRIPHALPVEKRRFAGLGSRATRLPLDYLMNGDAGEE